MTKRILAIVLALAMVFGAGSAMADMSSGTADYDVTLGDVCTVDTTAATTSFGFHPLMSPPLAPVGSGSVSAGSVDVTCSPGVNYILGADGGLNAGATTYPTFTYAAPTTLAMVDGSGNFVGYYLHDGTGFILGDADLPGIDPLYSPFSLNPTGANGWGGVGSGGVQTYGLFADVFIDDPALVAGTYTDTVTFTVVW